MPILLITGLGAREDRIEGIAAGCDDFLTKPVDFEELHRPDPKRAAQKALVDQLEQAENVLGEPGQRAGREGPLHPRPLRARGHTTPRRWVAPRASPATSGGNLKRAGLLHDIGKIGIPLEYLQKPGSSPPRSTRK